MTRDTEAVIDLLRDAAEHGPGMMDSGLLHAVLIDALAEIERLVEMCRTVAGNVGYLQQELVETRNHGLVAAERARAAGYEAGQRAMRERAELKTEQMEAWFIRKYIRELPILPEPKEANQ